MRPSFNRTSIAKLYVYYSQCINNEQNSLAIKIQRNEHITAVNACLIIVIVIAIVSLSN